jgi:hypothetical protein
MLAIWGVRSVLVPSWLETVTAVDLALSGVILLLLIGVAVRAALHLHRRAELHLPRFRQRTSSPRPRWTRTLGIRSRRRRFPATSQLIHS